MFRSIETAKLKRKTHERPALSVNPGLKQFPAGRPPSPLLKRTAD
jgi:hypothetical protein